MGAMGLFSTAYVLLLGTFTPASLNGCLFSCIFAAAAFAANGSTLRTHLPTLTGVFLSAFITGGIIALVTGNDLGFLGGALQKVGSRGMLLAALFSVGLAPIPAEHGWKAGVFIGFAHAILVSAIGPFHNYSMLYNNGLSFGLVATFLLPVYTKLGVKQEASKT